MILVSINPFALKKMFLLVVALLGLSSAICFGDPLFMSRRFALRDHQPHRSSPTVLSAPGQIEQPSFASATAILSDPTINWAACRTE
jgi:hypothetical protein